MKKAIWIIKHHGSTPDLPGLTRQFDLAKALADSGFQVTYFMSNFHYQLHRHIRPTGRCGYKLEQYQGVNLVWIRTYPHEVNDWKRVINFLDFSWRVYKIGSEIAGKETKINIPELIIAVNVPLFAPLSALYLARKFGARFFLDLADLWPQTLIDLGALKENSFPALVLKMLERYLYKCSEIILTPLPHVSDYLRNLGFANKLYYLERWVDLTNYSATYDTKKDKKAFKLMYIGAHGPANGLDIAVQGFEILKKRGYDNIELHLMGDGMEKTNLVKMAKNLALNNVKFHDAVPKNKVPSEIAQADAFLILVKKSPLYRYGINPNKIIDYLAAGKPIILAAEVKGDIVKQIKCGLSIEPENPEKLADAIIALHEMPHEKRQNMGKKGRIYAEENFNREKIIGNFIKEACL